MKVTAGGTTVELGAIETKPTISLINHSRLDTDDFGVTTVVERGFSRRLDVRMALPDGTVDAVQRRLAGLRATVATWTADEALRWLTVEGFYREFELDLAVPPVSYCTLTVEGLAESSVAADLGGDPAPPGDRSDLQLLQPFPVTEAMLVASSVPENDAPAWSSTASYAAGARVVRSHRVYESLVGGNAGSDPLAGGIAWLDTGPTNRWAMLDEALGTVTSAPGSIEVVLRAGAPVSGIALLDVAGASVRVMAGPHDITKPVVAGAAVTFLELAIPAGADIVVTTAPGAGGAAAGTLLLGRLVSLGVTEASPTAGITDFSRKEVDDFGEVTIVPRTWAKRMEARSLIRTDAVDTVADRIAAVRAHPALWIGQEGIDSLTVYGIFRDFSIEVDQGVSILSLQIHGLSAVARPAPLLPDGAGEVAWPDILDPDGTKPKDYADETGKNTSKDTDAVGGRPADQLLITLDNQVYQIGEILQDIDTLYASLGQDTQDLVDAIAQARAARDMAITKAGEAGGYATTAQQHRDAAAGSVTTAQGWAVVAGENATVAEGHVATSGQNASATASDRAAASTFRGQAETFAQNAFNSQTLASGSAALALNYAQTAARLTRDSLLDNPTFSDWSEGHGVPHAWVAWQGNETFARLTSTRGGPAIGFDCNPNQAFGFVALSNDPLVNAGLRAVRPGQWLMVEADVLIRNGSSLVGLGILIVDFNANGVALNEHAVPFSSALAGGVPAPNPLAAGKVVQFRVPVRITHPDVVRINVYALANYPATGFDPNEGKHPTFQLVSVRPMSESEVRGERVPALEATVTVAQAAQINALEERAKSFFQVATNAGTALAFLELKTEVAPGVVTSQIAMGAREYHLFSEAEGGWKKALSIVNGNALLTGGLQAGAFIRLGNGVSWSVALQTREFEASDGETVNFGADVGGLPRLTFLTDGLAPLNNGETYQLRAEALTSTGLIARLKIAVPGTVTNQSVAQTSTSSSAPTARSERGAKPVSASGVYNFYVQASGNIQNLAYGEPGYAYVEVDVWVRKGGVWQAVGSLSGDASGGFGGGSESFSIPMNASFQCGDGVEAFGASISRISGTAWGTTVYLSQVTWLSQASSAGTRSATPNGERARILVSPQ